MRRRISAGAIPGGGTGLQTRDVRRGEQECPPHPSSGHVGQECPTHPPIALLRRRSGFTLIELLIASFIAALTISTVFLTLNSSIKTFHAGEKSMDLYQSARMGMERLAAEVRQAINPEGFWKRRRNPQGAAVPTTLAAMLASRDTGEVDLEANTITFKGSTGNMTFVEMEADVRLTPPYDLREYEFKVDDEGQLVKVSNRSALAEQMAAWRAMRFRDDEEAYYTAFMNESQAGVQPREYVLTDNVESLHLRYYDGKEWRDTWDSEEILTPPDANAEEIPYGPGERPVKLGLPIAVEIVLTFSGHKSFYTVTDVPASLLNLIPHSKTGKAISRGGGRYLRDRSRRSGSSVELPPMEAGGTQYVDPASLPGVGRYIGRPVGNETRYR